MAATPSWWRLLLVPIVVLPALTLHRPVGRLLAGQEDPWVELALAPAPVPAPIHRLRTSQALRYGVDTDVARAA